MRLPWGQTCYPEPLRRVHYRAPETGKEYAFLTNRLDLSAPEWPSSTGAPGRYSFSSGPSKT
jgi:hypothetical protein